MRICLGTLRNTVWLSRLAGRTGHPEHPSGRLSSELLDSAARLEHPSGIFPLQTGS